jgi:hypothetical protein
MTTKLRKVERFYVDGEGKRPGMSHSRVTGYWDEVKFTDLRKGDIFRLWDPDGKPDHMVDGYHDVCVALADPLPQDDESKFSVESLHVNGFRPYGKGEEVAS